MAAPTSSIESKRSWRQATGESLDDSSRHFWRWLLAALLLASMVCAAWWFIPRPSPKPLLLVVTGEPQERVLPSVPFAAGDAGALVEWAEGAGVAHCGVPLASVRSPREFAQQLGGPAGTADRWQFTLKSWNGRRQPAKKDDLVILYVKGHGLAVSSGDAAAAAGPAAVPLLMKSFGAQTLADPAWHQNAERVLDVAQLLRELAPLKEIRKLLILDAVHMSYDPRLGLLTNGFPQAVKAAAQELKAENLWVVVGQAGGAELSRGEPAKGRSLLVETLIGSLEQNSPSDARTVGLQDLIATLRQQLQDMQTPELVYPPPDRLNRPAARLTLVKRPYVPPAEEGKNTAAENREAIAKAGQQVARDVATEAARQAHVPTSTSAVLPPAVDASAREVSDAAKAVASASADKSATGAPPGGGSASGNTGKQAPDALSAPAAADTASAAPTAAPAAQAGSAAASAASPAGGPGEARPPTDLELAWQLRDALAHGGRSGWSPIQVAPVWWRRVEVLLCSFDEDALCQTPLDDADRATLRDLARGLAELRAVFDGESRTVTASDCRPISQAYNRFLRSPAHESFASRVPGALAPAVDAVKVLAEGTYAAADYVRLHGRLAGAVHDDELERLLQNLAELRRLVEPQSVPGGQLNDPRASELLLVTREVRRNLGRLSGGLADFARQTAGAVAGADKMHVARLLLQSPLLEAKERQPLRDFAAPPPGTTNFAPQVKPDLTRNAELWRLLIGAAFPRVRESTPPRSTAREETSGLPPAAGLSAFLDALKTPPASADTLAWLPLGQQFRKAASELGDAVARANTTAASPATQLEWYLASLLVDGRDAIAAGTSYESIWLAQPLKAPPTKDRITIKAPEDVPVPGPGSESEPALVQFELAVDSDKPAPHPITLEWSFPRELNVVWADGGAAVIPQQPTTMDLSSARKVVSVRVSALQDSAAAAKAVLRLAATFAGAQDRRDVVCSLPRPNDVDLVITASAAPGAIEEGWSRRGNRDQEGGRLLLFPNRENTLSFFLRNLSSENKKLKAALYAVPRGVADNAGRLFVGQPPRLIGSALVVEDGKQKPAWPLLAQTGEKELLDLQRDHADWTKLPLQPAAGAQPPAAPAPGTDPAKSGPDVTRGLLLVLSGEDDKPRYFKWIELQTYRPHQLLDLTSPQLREGKLSFAMALRDSQFVQQMGLVKQPVKIVWDKRPLPPQVVVTEGEKELAASANPRVELAALVARPQWPLFMQFHVDGYPRGLVFRLDQSLVPDNLKLNKPPSIHIPRVEVTVEKSEGPPERTGLLFDPPEPWLAYPNSTSPATDKPASLRRDAYVRVEEKATVVRFAVDVAADGVRDTDDGVRVTLNSRLPLGQAVTGQSRDFPHDRQMTARLRGVEAGSLVLQSEVTDLAGIAFDPWAVSGDQRVQIRAEVRRQESSAADRDWQEVAVVLDRMPPAMGPVSVAPAPALPVAPPVGGAPPIAKHRLRLECPVSDGRGSGVASVDFYFGFDTTPNGRLDKATEEQGPVPATLVGDRYVAECEVPTGGTTDLLLVEARAKDNVGHTAVSQLQYYRIPKPAASGGNRSTFGGKKLEEEPGQKDNK